MNTLDTNQVTLLGMRAAFAKTYAENRNAIKVVSEKIKPEDVNSLINDITSINCSSTVTDCTDRIKSFLNKNINEYQQFYFLTVFQKNLADYFYQAAAGAAVGPVGQVATGCSCK